MMPLSGEKGLALGKLIQYLLDGAELHLFAVARQGEVVEDVPASGTGDR